MYAGKTFKHYILHILIIIIIIIIITTRSPKTRKKMREKERRQILNSHYNTLLQLLKPRPNTRRMEKTSILEETITMMKALIRTNNMLQERNKEMETEVMETEVVVVISTLLLTLLAVLVLVSSLRPVLYFRVLVVAES